MKLHIYEKMIYNFIYNVYITIIYIIYPFMWNGHCHTNYLQPNGWYSCIFQRVWLKTVHFSFACKKKIGLKSRKKYFRFYLQASLDSSYVSFCLSFTSSHFRLLENTSSICSGSVISFFIQFLFSHFFMVVPDSYRYTYLIFLLI